VNNVLDFPAPPERHWAVQLTITDPDGAVVVDETRRIDDLLAQEAVEGEGPYVISEALRGVIRILAAAAKELDVV
jgi:hypothetical protein